MHSWLFGDDWSAKMPIIFIFQKQNNWSETTYKKALNTNGFKAFSWRAERDSNPRPTGS